MNASNAMEAVKHPRGVIVPLLTPVDEAENIRHDQLEALVEHVIAGGVDGVFVMGTSGECARFTMEERAQAVATVVRKAGGRVPVYAGVSDCGTKLVKRHIANAAKAGADAVVATPPYYFPTVSQKEAVAFYRDIADTSPLPVVIYNLPAAVGVSLGCDVIEALYQHPRIVAVKDTSGDLPLLEKLLARFQGESFAVLAGDESLLQAAFERGADGCIPSLANPFPRLLSALYRAALDNDGSRLSELCGRVDRFNRLNKCSDSWMCPNIWRKAALAMMGVTGECFTAPYEPLTDIDRQKVRQRVQVYTAMVASGEL